MSTSYCTFYRPVSGRFTTTVLVLSEEGWVKAPFNQGMKVRVFHEALLELNLVMEAYSSETGPDGGLRQPYRLFAAEGPVTIRLVEEGGALSDHHLV
jgi:hypothetical protein